MYLFPENILSSPGDGFPSNSQLHFQELDKKILTKEIQSRMHFGQFFWGEGVNKS